VIVLVKKKDYEKGNSCCRGTQLMIIFEGV